MVVVAIGKARSAGHAFQVSDRAGQLDASQPRLTDGGTLRSAVESPGADAQLGHGSTEEALAGIVHRAVLAHFGRAHVGVAQQRQLATRAAGGAGKSLALRIALPLRGRGCGRLARLAAHP